MKLMSFFAASLFAASPSFADQAPWEKTKPESMSAVHEEYARSAKSFQDSNNLEFLGEDPTSFFLWGWQGDRNEKFPMSNMTEGQINQLFTGNYHIYGYATSVPMDRWIVDYHSADGMTYRCMSTIKDEIVEQRFFRNIAASEAGLSALALTDAKFTQAPDDFWSLPITANSETGELAIWEHKAGEWMPFLGFVQKEMPEIVQKSCPYMPAPESVNANQSDLTYSGMARSAAPLKGFQTAFKSDSRSPLTVEMFYWSYPPEN